MEILFDDLLNVENTRTVFGDGSSAKCRLTPGIVRKENYVIVFIFKEEGVTQAFQNYIGIQLMSHTVNVWGKSNCRTLMNTSRS